MPKTKALTKKDEVKEVVEYFELDTIHEYQKLFAALNERKQKYGFAICKNIDEGLKLRSFLFYVKDLNKVARILGMKVAHLQAIRDDLGNEGFYDNLLKKQSEELIYTTSRIMNKADGVAEKKLEMESAGTAASIAERYFNRGRILTDQATNITENRSKELYDDETIPIEERIRELERKIIATQTGAVAEVAEEERVG